MWEAAYVPPKLSHRLRLLQWAFPIAITLAAGLYQFGPARYVRAHYGDWSHYALEVLVLGGLWTTYGYVVYQMVRIRRS